MNANALEKRTVDPFINPCDLDLLVFTTVCKISLFKRLSNFISNFVTTFFEKRCFCVYNFKEIKRKITAWQIIALEGA